LDHGGITSPWVLFLDADEVVPTELAQQIEELCSASASSYDGYDLTPRYLFLGRWLRRTQGYPNWHPRLVKKDTVRFTGGVWEHFEPDKKIGRIYTPYDHYGNSKGLTDWLRRHDRYSSWDAERIVKFLESGNDSALGTQRKLKLRRWAARLWPFRPWVRFVQMYFLRGGFTEGRQAFIFCMLYFFYEWMIVVKIIEGLRRKKGLPL
jgi:hypothetical protein